MQEFNIKTRFDEACELLGITLKSLCDRAGVKYATLHAQLQNGRNVPESTIDNICHHWPLPRDHFSRYRATTLVTARTSSPSQMETIALDVVERKIQELRLDVLERKPSFNTFDVLDWVRRGGPSSANPNGIRSHCDLFYPMDPEENVPRPYSIGANSASRDKFRVQSEDEYSRKVSEINPEVLEAIKEGHMQIRTRPYDISDVELRVNVKGCATVSETYCRLMSRVVLPNNLELTLVHAEIIPDAPQAPHGQGEFLKPLQAGAR